MSKLKAYLKYKLSEQLYKEGEYELVDGLEITIATSHKSVNPNAVFVSKASEKSMKGKEVVVVIQATIPGKTLQSVMVDSATFNKMKESPERRTTALRKLLLTEVVDEEDEDVNVLPWAKSLLENSDQDFVLLPLDADTLEVLSEEIEENPLFEVDVCYGPHLSEVVVFTKITDSIKTRYERRLSSSLYQELLAEELVEMTLPEFLYNEYLATLN